MAKIIFSTVSGIPNSQNLPSFYEGFVRALEKEGNEVLVMINNKIIKNHWHDNKSSRFLKSKKLDRKILSFNPDFVITSNNSLYENIPKLVTCPIMIYAVDSPAVFADRDNLSKNIHQYHVAVYSESIIPAVKDYFGTGAKSLNVVQFASDFTSESIPQDKNISFIGSNFTSENIKNNLKDIIYSDSNRREFIKFVSLFKKDVLRMPEHYIKKYGFNRSLFGNISHLDLLNLLSSNFRVKVLQEIADLGLNLYGSRNWYELYGYSIDLALSFVNQEVSSVQENQDIYNSSKISINISHAQAGTAFSWRVRDIMACNSALVSDFRNDLNTQFGKYVKIPTYENSFEARHICKKLLRDELWRKDIIIGSQLAIEDGHRFKHRLIDIGEIIGINLFPGGDGAIEYLNVDSFLKKKLLEKLGVTRGVGRKRK